MPQYIFLRKLINSICFVWISVRALIARCRNSLSFHKCSSRHHYFIFRNRIFSSIGFKNCFKRINWLFFDFVSRKLDIKQSIVVWFFEFPNKIVNICRRNIVISALDKLQTPRNCQSTYHSFECFTSNLVIRNV